METSGSRSISWELSPRFCNSSSSITTYNSIIVTRFNPIERIASQGKWSRQGQSLSFPLYAPASVGKGLVLLSLLRFSLLTVVRNNLEFSKLRGDPFALLEWLSSITSMSLYCFGEGESPSPFLCLSNGIQHKTFDASLFHSGPTGDTLSFSTQRTLSKGNRKRRHGRDGKRHGRL